MKSCKVVRPEMKMSSRQRRRHSYVENARNERMGTGDDGISRRRNLIILSSSSRPATKVRLTSQVEVERRGDTITFL